MTKECSVGVGEERQPRRKEGRKEGREREEDGGKSSLYLHDFANLVYEFPK